MSKIVILDDEPDILELISLNLKQAHHDVKEFLHPKDLLDYIKTHPVDLLILDLMLPDIDGLEVCKIIRNNTKISDTPIIMLSAKNNELDKVLGLKLGADDYMTKPFSPKELLARIKTVLRRKTHRKIIRVRTLSSKIVINLDTHEVRSDNQILKLTGSEFKILELLSERPGWVYSRDKILNHLWSKEKAVIDRTIDVHILHLRKKLGDQADIIQSIRGVGYKLLK